MKALQQQQGLLRSTKDKRAFSSNGKQMRCPARPVASIRIGQAQAATSCSRVAAAAAAAQFPTESRRKYIASLVQLVLITAQLYSGVSRFCCSASAAASLLVHQHLLAALPMGADALHNLVCQEGRDQAPQEQQLGCFGTACAPAGGCCAVLLTTTEVTLCLCGLMLRSVLLCRFTSSSCCSSCHCSSPYSSSRRCSLHTSSE